MRWCDQDRLSISGSLAMLAATRRASSRVNSLAAAPSRLLFEIDVGERVPVGVVHGRRSPQRRRPTIWSKTARRSNRGSGRGRRFCGMLRRYSRNEPDLWSMRIWRQIVKPIILRSTIFKSCSHTFRWIHRNFRVIRL